MMHATLQLKWKAFKVVISHVQTNTFKLSTHYAKVPRIVGRGNNCLIMNAMKLKSTS